MHPTQELIYEYRLAREQAINDAQQRREDIAAVIPRFGEIAKERRDAAFAFGLASLAGEATDAKERIAALDAEETALLKSYSLSERFLQPYFRCDACCDTGYIGDIKRTLCPCMLRRIYALRYSNSDINYAETFSAFRTDIYPSEKQCRQAVKAMGICKSYADTFPENEIKNILLMGGTGLGKSFLLNAIAVRVSERGHSVLKLSARMFINETISAIRKSAEAPDFISPELLIIDDLGAEPMISTVTRETLFYVLNERQCAGRATAFSTNLCLSDIQDAYADRFFSRLISPHMTLVLRLKGEDLRLAE